MPAALNLPPIRTDIEKAKVDLDQFGLTRFHGAFSAAELDHARTRIFEQAAGEDAAGIAFHDAGDERTGYLHGPNQRLWNLINKGEIFRRLVLNPVMNELMRHMLGKTILLSSLTVNIANPGGVPQALHTDTDFAPTGAPFALVANSIFMMDDFTDENGGTRVVPGSHLSRAFSPANPPAESVAATGPAGTLFMFDGRLWHGTGANRSQGPRTALLAYFCRPYMRQQENLTMSVAPEVLEGCSPELLELLGFRVWRTLGNVDGSLHGVINPRPSRFVTELRP